MNKLTNSLLALCLLGSYAGIANADQGQFYLAPGFQWMDFDDGFNWDDDQGYFLGFGYDLTDAISIELSTFDLDPENAAGMELDIDHYKLDLFHDLPVTLGAFETFAVTGIGNTAVLGERETIWDIGAGINYEITRNLSWRTAFRNYYYMGRDFEDSDFGIDTALVLRFGGSSRSTPARRESTPAAPAQAERTPEPAPTPAIADADRDGVADNRDNCPDTPRNYAVDANGCPIAIEEVARVELLVNFDFDQADVKAEYFGEIEEVADFMRQYPDTIIELEGHTDSRGADAYNLDLSQRRADAVRAVLIDRFNIQGSRITAEGFGETQPVASNNTDAGRAQNRRVITVIIKTLQNYQPR